MRKFFQLLAAFGMAGCLLAPSFADAKPKPKSSICQLNSQEFVLFEMDISQKLISLQEDLIASGVNDATTRNALKKVVDANNALYIDLGRKASMNDKFAYTSTKLVALNEAASDYYSTVFYTLRNRRDHLMDAYKVVEATKMALNEFESQCAASGKRPKNWSSKWDAIYNASDYKEPVNRPGFSIPGQNNVAPAPAPNNGHVNNGNTWGRPGMDEAAFNHLNNSVSNAGNDNNRNVTIDSAINGGNKFTCDQITTLLKPFDFDSNRLSVANKLIDAADGQCTSAQVVTMLKTFRSDGQRGPAAVKVYDIVSDKGSWFMIYDTFDFPSTRQSVETQIRNKR